jgi:hypothetical protein
MDKYSHALKSSLRVFHPIVLFLLFTLTTNAYECGQSIGESAVIECIDVGSGFQNFVILIDPEKRCKEFSGEIKEECIKDVKELNKYQLDLVNSSKIHPPDTKQTTTSIKTVVKKTSKGLTQNNGILILATAFLLLLLWWWRRK